MQIKIINNTKNTKEPMSISSGTKQYTILVKPNTH